MGIFASRHMLTAAAPYRLGTLLDLRSIAVFLSSKSIFLATRQESSFSRLT
jgi:hypothetical protein